MSYRRILAFSLTSILGCSAVGAGAPGDPQVKKDPSREKFDAGLLLELEKVRSGGESDHPVDVLIRTRATLTAKEKEILEMRGARVGSITGDILTAAVPVRALAEIAGLDFVVFIEKAKRLRLR